MQTTRFQTVFYVFLFLTVLTLAFFVLRPYLTALFLAFVFYIVCKPVFKYVARACGGPRGLAAFLTIVLVVFLVLVPLAVFGSLLFDDARDLYTTITTTGQLSGALETAQDFAQEYVSVFVPGFSIDISTYATQASSWVINHIGVVFSGFTRFVFGLAIMLLALFYFLKDGDALKQKLLLYSPLNDEHDKDIFNYVERAINSVVLGSLLVACVQGLLIGVGFAFTGIPNSVTLGAVGVVAALIPSFGTSLVIIPGVLFLFLSGKIVSALLLLVWGVFAVGLIDNVLRPLLITRFVSIHPLLILLSVMGGIGFFGLVGFVAGPVVMSLLYVLTSLYPSIVKTTGATK